MFDFETKKRAKTTAHGIRLLAVSSLVPFLDKSKTLGEIADRSTDVQGMSFVEQWDLYFGVAITELIIARARICFGLSERKAKRFNRYVFEELSVDFPLYADAMRNLHEYSNLQNIEPDIHGFERQAEISGHWLVLNLAQKEIPEDDELELVALVSNYLNASAASFYSSP